MMRNPGCLSLFLATLVILFLSLIFVDFLDTTLHKLGMSHVGATCALFGIFIGSFINIPVQFLRREEEVFNEPNSLYGMGFGVPDMRRARSFTILAVNVGGCLVPAAIAVMQIVRIIAWGSETLTVMVAITLLVTVVTYYLARPIEGRGIAMPALIPPVVAAIPSYFFAGSHAPSVAFVAGTIGTLVGADLLHLEDIKRINVAVASIGGAGTFDGIVLSGMLAAFLA
ncbi:hypothetical protein Pan216_00610 [Planctomycetes bacterium Pan216]|uniref:DUF1614 domain-containing protein n=1 Tax=Kolteria novifilia TaxID=2527975 RepID=A0A518AWY3_9BACT|nr:hypothetical protein Pan216_00610 [Planctomycetes bacterium Pan216]